MFTFSSIMGSLSIIIYTCKKRIVFNYEVQYVMPSLIMVGWVSRSAASQASVFIPQLIARRGTKDPGTRLVGQLVGEALVVQTASW